MNGMQKTKGLSSPKDIFVYELHVSAGFVYSCGRGIEGQLGIAGRVSRSTPHIILGGRIEQQSIVSIAAGLHHSLAVSRNHRVYSWGLNSLGQLGLGDDFDRETPTLVERLSSYTAGEDRVVQVASGGGYRSFAISKYKRVCVCV